MPTLEAVTVALPAPVLVEHDGFLVVRDDLLLGGSKVRAAVHCLDGYDEWVYAGPAQGYAQVGLAVACEMLGKQATFFTAKRNKPTVPSRLALAHGLNLVEVPYGRLTVVRARAREYVEQAGPTCAPLIGMGLALPGFRDHLAAAARAVPVNPTEVWVACGSGVLASALHDAWPHAVVHAVCVGMEPTALDPACIRHDAPEPFSDEAIGPLPPYPSPVTYDAKVWRFVLEQATPGALVWNVAG